MGRLQSAQGMQRMLRQIIASRTCLGTSSVAEELLDVDIVFHVNLTSVYTTRRSKSIAP